MAVQLCSHNTPPPPSSTVDLNRKIQRFTEDNLFFLKIYRAAQNNYRDTPVGSNGSMSYGVLEWREGVSSAKSVGARGDGVARPDRHSACHPPVYRHTNRTSELGERETTLESGRRVFQGVWRTGEDTGFIVLRVAGVAITEVGGLVRRPNRSNYAFSN